MVDSSSQALQAVDRGPEYRSDCRPEAPLGLGTAASLQLPAQQLVRQSKAQGRETENQQTEVRG